LISGGYDKTVTITDLRSPEKPSRFPVDANVETVRWDPLRGTLFWVSTESGALTCHDARKPGEKIFTLKAHDTATTALSLNRRLPLLATAAVDGFIKLWDLSEFNTPKLLVSKQMKVGALFCMAFDVSNPYILAAAGGQGTIQLTARCTFDRSALTRDDSADRLFQMFWRFGISPKMQRSTNGSLRASMHVLYRKRKRRANQFHHPQNQLLLHLLRLRRRSRKRKTLLLHPNQNPNSRNRLFDCSCLSTIKHEVVLLVFMKTSFQK
jgi:hypothetical protein